MKYFLHFDKHNQKRNPNLLDKLSSLFFVDNPKDADMILVCGGDGSVLTAVSKYSQYNKPFLALNAGTVGFYTNQPTDENINKLKNSSVGDYKEYTLPFMSVDVVDEYDNLHHVYALSDVWVKSLTNTVNYKINTEYYNSDKVIIGDGVLISTPVGSTGYAHALSGTLFSIDMPIFQVVPMASSYNKKPIRAFPILNNKKIEIEFLSIDFRKGYLFYDGIELLDISGNKPVIKKITIEKSKSKSLRLCFFDESFEIKYFDWLY